MKICRRKFLQGASAITILAAAPSLAGINNPGSGTATPSGPSGRTLINDGSSGESFIFANMLKQASSIGPLTTATYPFPAYLDSNGYPNNAPSNVLGENLQYRFGIPIEFGTVPMVAKFSGTGGFYLQPAAISNVVVTGTGVVDTSTLPTFLKVTGTDVRITFNFTTAPNAGQDAYIGYFMISTTYVNMNNMVLCRASDEAAINTNPNALNPDYVAMIRTLNPKIFRGLDISGANGANQSQFSQRSPVGAFSFFADRFPPECWAGTAAGTDVYTCSVPPTWAGLVDGATCIVQFTNANTLTGASVTLNVGGTGAHRITTLGPVDMNAGQISAGSIWTFTYSSVYGYWTGRTGFAGPLAASTGGLLTFVPIEQHIAIANAANAHLWYNVSHRYTTAECTALTSVVLTQLKSTSAFYPEYSNELWNFQFQQTSFIGNYGTLFGFADIYSSSYGLQVRRIMEAITTAWGGPNPRLRRVMAIQAYGSHALIDGVNVNRLSGGELALVASGGTGNAAYGTYTGNANYRSSPNRPIDFCDVLSYATYYGGGQLMQFDVNYSSPNNLAAPTVVGISKANPGVLSYSSDPGYITTARVQLQGVLGMTQINNMNVTLTRLTPTTYSMFTDSSLGTGVDTTAFSTYTASSGITALYPIVSGLTAWADLYATGTAPNITSAFNSVDTDVRSGFQYNNSHVLSQANTQSLLDYSTNIYPAWETVAASYDGARPAGTVKLTIDCYEGAFSCNVISAASCTILGISTTYATSVQNLLFAYKNDARLAAVVASQYAQFMASGPHAATPGQYQIVGTGGPWALTPSTLYSLPPFGSGQYKSWDAIVTFNH